MTLRMSYFCTASGDGTAKRPWHLIGSTATGARLRIADMNSDDIPHRFTLVLDGQRLQPCEVAWRADDEIGVRFVDA